MIASLYQGPSVPYAYACFDCNKCESTGTYLVAKVSFLSIFLFFLLIKIGLSVMSVKHVVVAVLGDVGR